MPSELEKSRLREGVLDTDKIEGTSWAYRCEACGKAGLYAVEKADPGYRIPDNLIENLKCVKCGKPLKLLSGCMIDSLWYRVV